MALAECLRERVGQEFGGVFTDVTHQQADDLKHIMNDEVARLKAHALQRLLPSKFFGHVGITRAKGPVKSRSR